MSNDSAPAWKQQGLKYYRLNCFYKQLFGRSTWKVSVDAGCQCPNWRVDAPISCEKRVASSENTQAPHKILSQLATRNSQLHGCIFCNSVAFSPSRRIEAGDIFAQIETGIEQLQKRYKAQQFIAYFQPSTNTYGDLTRLRAMWETAISHPKVVGLIIGTRPDCVEEDVLNALGELAQKKWTSLELGVQSLHDSTLEIINRGHDSACALDAIDRAKRVDKLHIGTHIILGLPGETPEMMNQTADRLAQTPIDAVKIHNIYIARNTVLEQWYKSGQFTPPSRKDYISWAADFIERMPENVVIDRISASVPDPYLVAPDWCSDSSGILLDLEAEFERRGTQQGSRQ
ncbi:MAG: TIGR01212 family radical SAM protein [Thermoguttaceae bacterium]|nr:TIGR01212 family radical SAM protein [Thermoguttaceae bacterium]